VFTAQITFISVSDLNRSHRFYSSSLGLPLVLDQGRCRIYRVADGAYIGTCDTRPPEPGSTILTLVIDDVDAVATRLARSGWQLEAGPRANPDFGIYQLLVRDPDGYLVEVQRFDDPDWNAN
jgi:catechol 2,3-dioxygenase-like lactoylglutathione lyase family enzyme